KTGFKNEIGNAKERFGKKSKAVEKAKEMCSHIVDEVKDVCSYVSDNTHRNDLSSETYNRKTVTVMILSRYENSWTKRI
ncbi:MAG: hypothetical protein UE329_04315, partial [Lachnospiraceae bacterium]|nr:hypothetical protein [Lachnospiraceae bacterium]